MLAPEDFMVSHDPWRGLQELKMHPRASRLPAPAPWVHHRMRPTLPHPRCGTSSGRGGPRARNGKAPARGRPRSRPAGRLSILPGLAGATRSLALRLSHGRFGIDSAKPVLQTVAASIVASRRIDLVGGRRQHIANLIPPE
jgi:hypothetical protein